VLQCSSFLFSRFSFLGLGVRTLVRAITRFQRLILDPTLANAAASDIPAAPGEI